MPSPVELDLTLRLPRRQEGAVDVRVTAPCGSTLADLWPLLDELVGAGAGPPVASCGGVTLDGSARLGVPPLVHGASLVLGIRPTIPAQVSGPVDLVVVAGPDAGHRVPLTPAGVVVGRSPGAGLRLADGRLSRRHVVVRSTDEGFRVTDLSSTNGTRVGDLVLAPGCSADWDGARLLAVGDSRLRVVRGTGPTAPTRARGDGRVTVHRAPRTRPPEGRVTVRAPTPPRPPHRGRIPWVAAALPLPFAAVLAVLFGPQLLAFALLSPLMLVGTVVGDRVGSRREHARALEAHGVELGHRRAELTTWRRLERDERWRDAPDPATVLAVATGPGSRVWERRTGGADAGRVRLGVGELPARSGWAPPTGEVEHAPLGDLPVTVELGSVHGLGVAGPPDEVAGVLTHVVGQVATLHSPRDLRLVVVTDHRSDTDGGTGASTGAGAGASTGAGGPLAWARWLPHTTAYGCSDTCLDVVRRTVAARERARDRGVPGDPVRVLVVLPDGAQGARGGELVRLLERGHDLGVWSLAGARTVTALPPTSRAVLDLAAGTADAAARLDVDGQDPVTAFTADRVGWWWGERLGRSLAPLVDASADGAELPDTVDLLDLLPWASPGGAPSAATLAAHWRAGTGRPVARLGRLAGDDWVVDLSTDGPHALVGGTTGSGKSELLRTLVTSLALESSPADLTFVLVDYKGGAAFGSCADLPHTVGLVTNLDDGLARRALTSLRAELDRRERLLATSGARDVDDHRRRAGTLARLVIVIDEFRLLADELPDFVDGVVSLAAVGRSLGIHLVLATQRPAGAVTADIQANVNLRIAMRVRDAADSTDVIESPDAAHLPPDRPGRGLARGGDGDLVEFQAARVGRGAAVRALGLVRLDPTGAPAAVAATPGPPVGQGGPDRDGTSLIATIAAVAREAAALDDVPRPHRPWLPPLPDTVGVDLVGRAGIGLVDLPDEQRQHPLDVDAAPGHWLVAGGPRSGRTTFARTVVAAHVVADPCRPVHVYVVDSSGELADLEELPQVGAVVTGDDLSRARRLLGQLRLVDQPGTAGPDGTRVLLVVDGWDRLDADGDLVGGLRDELLDVLRTGGSRLRAVVTGDRSLLSGRVGAVASETFVLPLADPSDATYAGLSPRDLPSSRVPGRALRLRDRREVQLARRDPVTEAVRPDGSFPDPPAIPRLPRVVDHRALLDGHHGPLDADPALLALGVSAETGGVAHLDLRRGRRVLVAGHAGSGRSSSLATLGVSALRAGWRVAVVEGRGGTVAETVGDVVAVDPWGPGRLVDARRADPRLVVLVDDAERLEGTPVDAVLGEIAALVDRDAGALVVATTPVAVATRFRGVVADVARAQTGLLLVPRTPSDGEPFGIRAPRGLAALPGRGLLVAGRRPVEIQMSAVTLPVRGGPYRGGNDEGSDTEHGRGSGR